MPGEASYFRDQAAKAEDEARRAASPDHREQYLKIAQGWRQLADEADRKAARRIPRET